MTSQATTSVRDTASLSPAAPLRVLIVDDEQLFARSVAKRLQQAGHECIIAASLAAARKLPTGFVPDLTLLDLRLPDGDGSSLLSDSSVVGDLRSNPVIVMSAFGELSDAVDAMKRGAADYLKKPLDLDELALVVDKVMATAELRHRLDYSRSRDSRSLEGIDFIGRSPAILRVRAQLERLARLVAEGESPAPTVLILGETGTGKDLAARILHLRGCGPDRPFVHVDCASLPRELMEAELFGHEKGAYTGAHGVRAGLIEAAENGTLFLDEIGELPLDLQAKLLNVIERRRARRIGSTRERPVLARVIAGTNRDLQHAIVQGVFRADLYYRLNVVNVTLPPLRDRGEDITLLANHYAALTGRRYRLPIPKFDADALEALRRYSWPGNVRELKHLIERAVLLSDGRALNCVDLSIVLARTPDQTPSTLDGMMWDEVEKLMLQQALKAAHGNVSEAARRLGVSRMAMRYRMERHTLVGSSG